MSDSKPPIHERRALLAEADELFEKGVDADDSGNWSGYGPAECWEEAVHRCNAAAMKYRNLGFGTKARQALSRAAECHRKIGREPTRWARDC